MHTSPSIETMMERYKKGELKVTSVGAGYVGSLTSVVMACHNADVKFSVCDINEKLIAKWNSFDYPFFEPN
jgi:UDP-glucose 6-dehydrogenase